MDNAQELIVRLNQSGKKLSKSHRRIAECIVSHYDKAAFMTASRLGEYVGVSESTVVRFAAALGYEGYPQLQKALQELIRHRLTASQRFEMTGDMDHVQVLSKVLKADIQNIRSTLDELNIDVFEEVLERPCPPGRSTCWASGRARRWPSSWATTSVTSFRRCMWSPRASATSSSSSAHIAEGDVLVGISFPRYTSRTIEAMELARRRGATLIAITDGPLSPLHAAADLCLTAKSDMASFVDSLAAPLSLINALIVALSQRKRQQVTANFNQLEEIWAQYNVYLSKSGE